MAGAAGTLTRSGTFVWEELLTSDLRAARDFYGKVIGWEFDKMPVDEGESFYTLVKADGEVIGGALEVSTMPPTWVTYVGVESADEAIAQARELGAEIKREPFDVQDVGRMGVIVDPGGAALCVWEE